MSLFYSTADKIIAYESGELSADQTVRLFADLIKSGMAWQLQGHYGRTAQGLIEGGVISELGVVDEILLASLVEEEL